MLNFDYQLKRKVAVKNPTVRKQRTNKKSRKEEIKKQHQKKEGDKILDRRDLTLSTAALEGKYW